MTFDQMVKAKKYVRRYGKDWTQLQVMNFFLELERCLIQPAVKAGDTE